MNKTITLTGTFSGKTSGWSGYIYQKDIFGVNHALSTDIDDNVDISMLFCNREYRWTGTIIENTNSYGETYPVIDVQQIETLYKNDGRHNTSKFLGNWKLIEEDLHDVLYNETWIFYKNNTININLGSEWGGYMIDGEKFYSCD